MAKNAKVNAALIFFLYFWVLFYRKRALIVDNRLSVFFIEPMNTHNTNNLIPYFAPQTDIFEIQVESNFMVESTTNFSSTFDFGEGGVEDGGDI
ncbi:MAG: hypothetical protein IJK19_00690 [Bacteroidales bacterium]|nr:hypothetical protein [Bacteroidales bacterium]